MTDESLLLDIDIIEMDLCLTKDDKLILNHNMTIDSSTEEKDVEGDYYYRVRCIHSANDDMSSSFTNGVYIEEP